MAERVGLWESARGETHRGLALVSHCDVGLGVGDPVHELTGQAQHLPLGLRELGEGEGEPGIALGHVRGKGGTSSGGELEDQMTTVGLVPKTRDEPFSLELCEHPRERLRPLMRGSRQRACRSRAMPIHMAEDTQLVETQALG